MSKNLPTNRVTLSMPGHHLAAARRYCHLYGRLIRGDLSAVFEMAKNSEIPQGNAASTTSWSNDALLRLHALLTGASSVLGYPLDAFADAVPYDVSSPMPPRSSVMNEIEQMLGYAVTRNPSAYSWAVTSHVAFPENKDPELSLSWTQALYLMYAAEMYTRLSLGQLEHIGEAILSADIPKGPLSLTNEIPFEFAHSFSDSLRQLKPAIGHYPNGSFGIGNQAVSPKAHLAWELRKEVQRVMALFLEPNPSFRGTAYDGNIVRYTKLALPVVSVEQESKMPFTRLPSAATITGAKVSDETRYLNFYAALGKVPVNLSDDEAEKAYETKIEPFYTKVKALVEERTEALPDRTFQKKSGGVAVTVERWELCDQSGIVEHRDGYAQSAFEFLVTSDFGTEHILQLRTVIEAAIDEVAKELGLLAGELTAELAIKYSGTAVTKLF